MFTRSDVAKVLSAALNGDRGLVVRAVKCQYTTAMVQRQALKIGVQRPQMCEPPPKRNKYLVLSEETFRPKPQQHAS